MRSELVALLAGRNSGCLCAGRRVGLMLCGRDSCTRAIRLSVDGVRPSSQWAEPDEIVDAYGVRIHGLSTRVDHDAIENGLVLVLSPDRVRGRS